MSESSQLQEPQSPPQPTVDDLRVEYQAAQDSAQYHDNLVWSGTSVMGGGSLVLMGFILTALKETSLRPLVTVLSLLGIATTVCVWIFALQWNAVKRHKYGRCKEIEAVLHMKQHTTLRWASSFQRVIYGALMVFFLLTWVSILWMTWCRCAG